MHSKELRRQRAALVAQAQAIITQAIVSPEDEAKFDTIMAEADRFGGLVDKAERTETIANEMAAVRDVARENTGVSVDKQESELAREKRLIVAFLARTTDRLPEADRAIVAQRINAAASTGSTTAGGYTVAPLFVAELLIAMKAYGGMRQAAKIIQTSTGAPLPWPTMDDTANVATIVGENTTGSAGTDLVFGTVNMLAFMYRSGYLPISYELLQDSAFDFDALIRDALAIRFARGQNAHFTTGSGTGQPQGVVTAAASGTVGATGQTLSVIYDDLVNLEHSVDPAYRVGAQYMMHDSSVKILRKLKDANGRPLFWDNTDDMADGVPNMTLNGRPVVVNQDMPVMAASAKSILFGNFQNYLIRDVMGVSIQRLNELFATNGQVAYIGFQRTDGRLISGATVSPIKYYQNSAT